MINVTKYEDKIKEIISINEITRGRRENDDSPSLWSIHCLCRTKDRCVHLCTCQYRRRQLLNSHTLLAHLCSLYSSLVPDAIVSAPVVDHLNVQKTAEKKSFQKEKKKTRKKEKKKKQRCNKRNKRRREEICLLGTLLRIVSHILEKKIFRLREKQLFFPNECSLKEFHISHHRSGVSFKRCIRSMPLRTWVLAFRISAVPSFCASLRSKSSSIRTTTNTLAPLAVRISVKHWQSSMNQF